MKQRFSDARAGDYRELLKDLRKPASANQPLRITRLRLRFQDIVSIDFFGSPLREQVERALNAMQTSKTKSSAAEMQSLPCRISEPRMGHTAATGSGSSDVRVVDSQVY